MIHFLEQHFVELVTITSIIYLTLATILLLYQTPDTAVYKTFRRSKRLMAGGMMLISLNIWIWIASFTGSWTEYNNWVPCFDIILFYLMASASASRSAVCSTLIISPGSAAGR